ncbi:pyridoxamine 5'-phosphate oxidase family protein [Niveibacterium terrae]|uniref:pyridoxamine 5'-phosphate oxidase family protein n=1 Tax=Niveibacterium terrae TaxID=3373598 RepID=UPI003A936E0D
MSTASVPSLSRAIASFLREHHVVGLATVVDGQPWAASCFYAFEEEAPALIVMSSLKTRHAVGMLGEPQIAGTIAAQPVNVLTIRGLQFTATAELLAGEARSAARSFYCLRHPVARLMPGDVWRLRFETIKYTDNARGLANKLYWTRSA